MKKFLVAALLCVSVQANAALVDNGINTFDPATGLNWLDLSATANLSYNYVISQFGAGGDFAGYRHATKDETLAFFDHAGIPGVVNGYQGSNYDPIVDLAVLMGLDFDPVRGTNDQFDATYDQINPTSGLIRTWALLARHYDMTGVIASSATSATNESPLYGHFLVAPSSVVPLPAAAWLFGTALIGLAGAAGRKRRRSSTGGNTRL